MKKEKKLLYLSFIPYIIVIILGIVLSFSYRADTYYRPGLMEFFSSFIFDLVFKYTIIFIIFLIGLMYQLYYLFKSKVKLGKILFGISISVWALYFLSSIYFSIFGYTSCFFNNCSTSKGLEAFRDSLYLNGLVFCFIPVLPITLIIIIVNIIRIIKNKNTK